MLSKNFILLLLFTWPFTLQAQQQWSLEQCITYAIDNNISIQQQSLSVDLNKDAYQQSKLSLLPSINGDASHSINYGRSIDPTTYEFVEQTIHTSTLSVGSNLILFSGLRKMNAIKQNEYALMSSRATFAQTRDNIALAVTSSYLQILLAKEQIILSQQQLVISDSQVVQTTKLVEAGSLPQGSLDEIVAQKYMDEYNLTVAENEYSNAMLNLKLLMNLNPTDSFAVENPEVAIDVVEDINNLDPYNIYLTALQNQPSVKSSEFRLKSAEKAISVAKSYQYPTLALFYNVRSNYSDARERIAGVEITGVDTLGFLSSDLTPVLTPSYDIITETTPFENQVDENLSQAVGLSLSIPIFNQWQNRTNIDRAKIELLSANYQLEGVKNDLEQEIYQSYTNARAAAKRYRAAGQSVEALRRAFQYAEQKYEAGMVNALQYSIAKSNLAEAESNLLQAKYDYLFKMKILDYYQGKTIKL